MKNWISVSKEVPSESKIYNITYKSTSGRRRSDSAFYNSQRKIWYWDEEEEKEVAREIVAGPVFLHHIIRHILFMELL
ncbi:MAG: hypothetical protein ACLRHW_18995 [Coprobacillus cateniformis]